MKSSHGADTFRVAQDQQATSSIAAQSNCFVMKTGCLRETSMVPAFAMAEQANHISVCVLTYKRPDFLKRLLGDLAKQETAGRFTYSIVVADNDGQGSAEALVSDFAAASAVPVTYCVEPQQNISLARNTAIANATGDFIAFIDDDEFPAKRWLLTLFEACEKMASTVYSDLSSATSTKRHPNGFSRVDSTNGLHIRQGS